MSTLINRGLAEGLGPMENVAPRSVAVTTCAEMQELIAQTTRATRAFLEQDERAKGSFACFEDAVRAVDLAEGSAQRLGDLRRKCQQHRDRHGCC